MSVCERKRENVYVCDCCVLFFTIFGATSPCRPIVVQDAIECISVGCCWEVLCDVCVCVCVFSEFACRVFRIADSTSVRRGWWVSNTISLVVSCIAHTHRYGGHLDRSHGSENRTRKSNAAVNKSSEDQKIGRSSKKKKSYPHTRQINEIKD